MPESPRTGILEAFKGLLARLLYQPSAPEPSDVHWEALAANLRAFQPTDRNRAA